MYKLFKNTVFYSKRASSILQIHELTPEKNFESIHWAKLNHTLEEWLFRCHNLHGFQLLLSIATFKPILCHACCKFESLWLLLA